MSLFTKPTKVAAYRCSRPQLTAVLVVCATVLLLSLSLDRRFYRKGRGSSVALHEKTAADTPVWWFAPFFDRSSFGIEAATLVLGLIRWVSCA